MAYFQTSEFGNIKKMRVLYWAHSQKPWSDYNNFWDKLFEFYQKYLVYSKFLSLKDFEYEHSNTNRKTWEWIRNKNWVERFRGRKTKGFPLILLNEGEEFSVEDSGDLIRAENLYKDLSEMKEAR